MEQSDQKADEGKGSIYLSWLWTPLVIVTSAHGGRRSGQVALTAHGASIVSSRPRLSVALWKDNFTCDLVRHSGAFAVHLLRDDQDELVYRFGLRSGRSVDKFAGLDIRAGAGGVPLLSGCLAAFECAVVNRMDGGDHIVFLADVTRSTSDTNGSPLWWRDLRPRMPADKRAIWEAKQASSIAMAIETMERLDP
jgi:flavin reductase (DIM6/NTAB) family NADH-FMN oxidoreductase RutF